MLDVGSKMLLTSIYPRRTFTEYQRYRSSSARLFSVKSYYKRVPSKLANRNAFVTFMGGEGTIDRWNSGENDVVLNEMISIMIIGCTATSRSYHTWMAMLRVIYRQSKGLEQVSGLNQRETLFSLSNCHGDCAREGWTSVICVREFGDGVDTRAMGESEESRQRLPVGREREVEALSTGRDQESGGVDIAWNSEPELERGHSQRRQSCVEMSEARHR
ncbi:hypothetical protein EDB85DRAFT_1899728 [Lactarius pseudohatsudake]|nr:hypothetical protein EDB85DRAFT_1899728 [Lactarius pseudohatsudake]